MKIRASEYKKLTPELKRKWRKKLVNVFSQSDMNGIILIGELLELLSGQECKFTCSGKVDYGMFSDCNYSWTLSAGRMSVSRALSRDISESWQRVEEFENSIQIHGLSKYNFSWNGETGGSLSTLEINLKLADKLIEDKFRTIGKTLYSDFTIN